VSGYKWQGGTANGGFVRAGSRKVVPGDEARGKRLFELLAAVPFLCETCGQMHALREHRLCRAGICPDCGRPA